MVNVPSLPHVASESLTELTGSQLVTASTLLVEGALPQAEASIPTAVSAASAIPLNDNVSGGEPYSGELLNLCFNLMASPWLPLPGHCLCPSFHFVQNSPSLFMVTTGSQLGREISQLKVPHGGGSMAGSFGAQ